MVNLVIALLQDLLHFDNESLFNTPGTSNETGHDLKNFDDELQGDLRGIWRTSIDLEALKTSSNGNREAWEKHQINRN